MFMLNDTYIHHTYICMYVGLEQYISGVILLEETLYQNADDATPFVEVLKKKGIIPGIKVYIYLNLLLTSAYNVEFIVVVTIICIYYYFFFSLPYTTLYFYFFSSFI